MTKHEDIYKKLLIEYDKANITSSYPSLTKTEYCALLNKAYQALISQKVTGNNPRRSTFESDFKSIEDLRPLVKSSNEISIEHSMDETGINNLYEAEIPDKMMYYIQSYLRDVGSGAIYNTELITHQMAQMFKQTANNTPWIENPVVYLLGDKIYILLDPSLVNTEPDFDIYITFIKKPIEFSTNSDNEYFELSDSMVEELINLAILFATEITESPRLQSKSSTLQLES